MESRRLRLLPLLAIEIGSVVILHLLGRLPWMRVGWTRFGDWVGSTPPEDAIAAVLRVIALGIAYWLLATTTVYCIARLSRIPAAIRVTEWATIPAVRRTVDGVVALSLTGVLGATPALAQVANSLPPTAAIGVRALPTPDTGAGREDREPAPDPAPPPASPRGPDQIGWIPRPAGPTGDSIRAGSSSVAPRPAPDSAAVTVNPGDHLWAIASSRLHSARNRPIAEVEITSYWLRVVDANRSTLRSGDPDLIYPGEIVILPPVEVEDRP